MVQYNFLKLLLLEQNRMQQSKMTIFLMKRMNKSITVILILLLCNYNMVCCSKSFYVADIRNFKKYIGQNIDSIHKIAPFFLVRTTVDGDEGGAWGILKCKIGKEALVTMEGNWMYPKRISRIVFLSPKIRLDDIFVGQIIGNIRNKIDFEKPIDCPDGVLLLPLKEDKDITLQIDLTNISTDNPIWYGANIDRLPDSMKIETIILTD